MKFLSANKFIIAALMLCISACIAVFLISLKQTKKVTQTSIEVVHTNKVLGHLDDMITATLDIQNGTHGYVITGDEKLLAPVTQADKTFTQKLSDIAVLEKSKTAYAARLDSLHLLFLKRMEIGNRMIQLRRENKTAEAAVLVAAGEGNRLSVHIRQICNSIKLAELDTQNETRITNERAILSLNTILYSTLIIVMLLGVLLFVKVKTAFEEHRAGEEKFKALLESAPDAMLITDNNGIIQLVNRQAEKLLNYSREEMTGMPVEKLMPEEHRRKHINLRGNYSHAPGVRHMDSGTEMQALRKDGIIIPVEISLSPINTNGEVLVASAIRDISQRIAARQEIQNLAVQINQASEAIYVVDSNFEIQSWNKGAENLYGFSKEEAIGRNSVELLQTSMTREEINDALKDTANTGFWSAEIKRTSKSGNEIYVYSSLSAVKSNNGHGSNYVSVSLDITDRKILEGKLQHLAAIVENSSEAIFSVEVNGNIVSWNNGAEKMFGYAKEEAIGKKARALGLLRISNEEIQIIEETLLKQDVWDSEKKFYHKNGTEITGAVTANKMKDNGGVVTGFSFVVKDISARKLLEQHLREYNDELEQKIKMRTGEIAQSEAKYRLLYENNPMPMWVFDLETFRFLDVNEAALKMYGYSRAEFLSMSIYDIRSEAERERLAKQDHSFEETETSRRRGIWPHIRKDGSTINVEIFVHSILFEGRKARLTLVNNVTEKFEAEEKLKASEKRFRALIENNYDVITMLDKDFNIVYRSPSTKRITGFEDDEMIGGNGLKNVHPDDVPVARNAIMRLLSKPGSVEVSLFRMQHKNGNYMWMEGNATNLLHDENVKAIVLNYRDVTERILAENRVKASEKRFRALIENSYDIITMLDRDFKVLYRSPSANRITGRDDEDVIGLDARQRIHPDDLPAITEGIKRLLAAPGNTESTIFRYQHKDGSYLWMEGNATNLLNDENVKAVIFNYRDVSERRAAQEKLKASEERYRTALDNMIEGIQIIGFDWKYKFVNKTVVKQSKYSRNELLGYTMMDRYPGIEHTDLYKAVGQCFTSRIPVQLENKFVYPDETVGWFELSIQPVPEGVFILSVDITKKVNADAALKEEKDKLATIAATSPGLIYSFRMKPNGLFSFPFVSNAVRDIFGITDKEIMDNVNPILQSALEEDLEHVVNSIRESARTMSPWQLAFRYKHPVKGIVWLEGNSLPMKEADGSIIWHGIIIDITDRKKTEEKIIEKSAQLETLSNNLPGVMIYQLSGNDFNNRSFTYVSKEVTRLTGKTPEEVIADPSLLYGLIHEGDMPKLLEAERESFKQMREFNEEVRCRTKDGEIKWLNIVSTPRKTMDGKMVWDGFHVDITERKKNEAALRSSYVEKRMLAEKLTTILNTLPANIALLDEKGTIVDVNQSWIEFASANHWYGANYGLGENYIKLSERTYNYADTDRQKVAEGINAVLHKRSEKCVYEYVCHTKNRQQWFRKIVSPLLGEGYTGAVVMHIDITETKRLEEERMKRKTEEQKMITRAILQGQEKERNAIGKELHDNINQILAGVNMLLGLISKRPERLNELLPLCIQHMSTAMAENRKIAHKLVVPNEDSASLLELVQKTTGSMLQKAGMDVNIDSTNFDETLLNKEQKLAIHRIIQEQCTNIAKYSSAKKVLVLLHTGESRFLLVIKDDGQGMDLTQKTEGIGLQNIKSRISVLNGIVAINTKPGAGFTLTADIPIKNNRKILK